MAVALVKKIREIRKIKNMARMHKKGLFFTMISILIVSLLILTFSSTTETPLTARLPTIEKRVLAMNEIVGNIKDIYAQRMLRVATIRTLHYFIDNFNEPIANFDALFEELVVNGTIDGQAVGEFSDVALTTKFDELEQVLNTEFKVNSQITPINATILQDESTGPWNVKAQLGVNIFVDGDIAKWNITTYVNSTSSILGFYDPLYIYNAVDFVNIIEKDEVREKNLEVLKNFIANQKYRNEPLAPNFIQRFKNDFSPSSCCGIESMINTEIMLSEQLKNASFVDYCYWSDACLGEEYGVFIWKIKEVSDLFPGFLLDSYHSGVFNVSNDTTDFCKYNGQTWEGDGCNAE